MSMTAFQLEGLRLLGYTERESEFLFLVATHSGYFTTHQFKSFLGSGSGSLSHGFVHKLLERRHATYRAYRSGERVYHLFARRVYQAIERESLRTRKKHELEYVKTRLVALDFVLSHPEHRYLETEAEKVSFFEKQYGLCLATLPVKLYRARRSADVTPRYFVDRFPLFLDGSTGIPTFTFVDSGAVTLDGFATHLRAYQGLFRALPAFDFVYIAPTQRFFEAAESVFRKIICAQHFHDGSPSILDYFRLRRAWDRKERVSSAQVVHLKEAQALYVAKHIEDLYRDWQSGSVKDEDVARVSQQFTSSNRIRFQSLRCGFSLKVFFDPSLHRPETRGNSSPREHEGQLSDRSSHNLSGP